MDCLVILFPTCFGLPCYSIPNMFWTALLFYSQHVLDCLVILFPTCFGRPCYSIPNMFWTALLFYSQHVFELLIMKVDLFILCYHNLFFKVALQLFTTVKNELYYWALCLIRTSFSKLCCLHFK